MVLAVRPANVWMTHGAGSEASEHWGKRAPVRALGQRGRVKECTGEGAVHAPAKALKTCARRRYGVVPLRALKTSLHQGAPRTVPARMEGAPFRMMGM